MTDRVKGFIVHLDEDIRDDCCDEIITALSMVKKVRQVTPLVSGLDDTIAYCRGRSEVMEKAAEFLRGLYEEQLRGIMR